MGKTEKNPVLESRRVAMNRISNNFIKISRDKYDVEFIDFALKNLSMSFQVSIQYLMCHFILIGLENHPIYSNCLDELREEFMKYKNEQVSSKSEKVSK